MFTTKLGLCIIAIHYIVMVVVGADSPSIESKIIGGSQAPISQFPYQILIKVPTGGNTYEYCGGALISPYWVLTAVHCFYGRTLNNVEVIAGRTSYSSGGYGQYAQQVTIHGNYGGLGLKIVNDIALVRVGQPFAYGPNVQPIALFNGNVADGTWAWVTGWGTVSATSNQIPDQLQKLQVRTISLQQCKQSYNNLQLSSNNLCATNGRTGTCSGDSGGPVMANGWLIGVVSAGPRPCGNGNPDIYMNVAAYRQWIFNVAGVK
ncbi:chymotrypsin-2-like [Oppia nitens]|uniref:chymotrypsin-2-like n=1 Tax=Oppia nitens TaxID=1686743 RepID=UPI0023DA6207|nr:chymotrypsin-2-like [Oppia nitens]